MNREIKFRGFAGNEANGKWFYGSLLKDYAGTCQIWEKEPAGDMHNYIVKPETVGQFTGLRDRGEVEAYEDDIVQVQIPGNPQMMLGLGRVIFHRGCFMVEWIDDKEANMELLGHDKHGRPYVFEVLGNVHENPDLLK